MSICDKNWNVNFRRKKNYVVNKIELFRTFIFPWNVDWKTLINHFCFTNFSLNFVSGVAGGTEFNPLGRLYRIVEVLIRLLEVTPKFKDRETSLILIKQLVHLLTHVTSQSIQRPLLKLISPVFEVILEKELIFALGTEFESKVKTAHEVIVNRLQSR